MYLSLPLQKKKKVIGSLVSDFLPSDDEESFVKLLLIIKKVSPKQRIQAILALKRYISKDHTIYHEYPSHW